MKMNGSLPVLKNEIERQSFGVKVHERPVSKPDQSDYIHNAFKNKKLNTFYSNSRKGKLMRQSNKSSSQQRKTEYNIFSKQALESSMDKDDSSMRTSNNNLFPIGVIGQPMNIQSNNSSKGAL